MSDLKFSCPHCSQHISCGPEWAGLQIKCPACQNDITIPGAKAPPPPPAVPAPGPLRVSMPSHQPSSASAPPPAPPPPPTARSSLSVARHTAPAAEQASPAPPPDQRATVGIGDNRAVQWAGLVGAFLVTGIIIAMAATWKPPQNSRDAFLAELNRMAKEAKEEAELAKEEDEEQGGTAAATASAGAPATAGWTLDVQSAQIPSGTGGGQFDGTPFTVDRTYLQRTPVAYVLSLRQGTGRPERELMIALPVGTGEALDNKTWTIAKETSGAPRVIKRWLQNGRQQTRVFTNGYAMKLEFGQMANNQVPTRLFIALPDEQQTYVGGTLTATILVVPASQTQQQRRQ